MYQYLLPKAVGNVDGSPWIRNQVQRTVSEGVDKQFLLRPEHLVQPRRRCPEPGSTTGIADHRTQGRDLVVSA
jgi:hypothetical protein